MLERIYVEIGNICNLACSFCPGTKRPPRQMTEREFERICSESAGRAKFIYLHVMGEPLLHPKLDELLSIAGKYGLKVCGTEFAPQEIIASGSSGYSQAIVSAFIPPSLCPII